MAQMCCPDVIAFDSKGNLYIGDAGNAAVRRVDAATGLMSTYAGYVTTGVYSGDGGFATGPQCGLNYPDGLVFDAQDNLYIADYYNNVIRKVDAATHIITTVVGHYPGNGGHTGDGGLAVNAELNNPIAIKFDSHGNLYIADNGNFCVRRVDAATGVITTVAGNGISDNTGDGGPATSASFINAQSICFDNAGNLLISDGGSSVVRRVNALTGIITTIIGNGDVGFSGDGGPALSASLDFDNGSLAVDSLGNIYITDDWNDVARKVDAVTGIITTVAGQGPPVPSGYSGDGGPATLAQFYHTEDFEFDSQGNMFIVDYGNNAIRKVTNVAVFFTPTPTPSPTPQAPDIFYVSRNAFIPSQEPVSIYVQYPHPGPFSLRIYNSAGEHIKTLYDMTVATNFAQSFLWDGKNKYQDTCASGVYLIYLSEPFDRKIKRVVLIK